MSKTYLVALREYVESLKTKAFWIGILAMPVILVLAVTVPSLLEKKRSLRRYVVIDHSEWLAQAIEEDATGPDWAKALVAARKRVLDGRGDELPAGLREIATRLKGISEQDVAALADQMSRVDELEAQMSQLPANLRSQLPEDVGQKVYMAWHKILRDWWKSLDAETAKELSPNLDKALYEEVKLEAGLGDKREARASEMLAAKEIFAYFVISRDPLTDADPVRYVSNNSTDGRLRNWFLRFANEEVKQRRFVEEGVDRAVVQRIMRPLPVSEKKLDDSGKEVTVKGEDKIRDWAPVAFVYILWMAIFVVAQQLLTNTVEEKSNRIIEVLLSSVSPYQLMVGKILGIAATGLTMIQAWVLFFFLVVKFVPDLLGISLSFDASFLFTDPVYLPSFVVYFLLGYLFYAAIFVGIGSVANSLKEAQNLMMPMFVLLMVPMLAMFPIAREPNGALAKMLTYIPPFTPFVMMNRAAGNLTFMEYALTTVLIVVSIVVAFWAAAKVFRIGVLMTGKPPKFLEILQWLRAPVGAVAERGERDGSS